MVTFNPFDPKAAFLMGAGSGLLQAGGWSPQPVGLGQALGVGLQAGQQGYLQAVQMARLQQQQKLEEGLQKARQAKLDREAAQYAAVQKAAERLPPEQRAFAVAFPKEFAASQFRAPPKFTAQNFYDPDNPSNIVTVTTPEEQNMAIQMGYVKGNPPKGWTVSTGPEGTTVTYGTGTGEQGALSKSTTSKLEQDILAKDLLVDRLGIIENRLVDEYLTYQGAGKAAVQEVLNKAGLSEAEFASERAMFASDVQDFFNQYRKDITGAAASILEMRDIQKAIPGMNDSPAVFRAKLAATQQWTQYVSDRQKAALQEGITPERGNKEYEEFAKRYAETNPPPQYNRPQEAGAVPAPQATGDVTRETIDQMTYEQLVDPSIVDTVPEELLPYAMETLRKRMAEQEQMAD